MSLEQAAIVDLDPVHQHVVAQQAAVVGAGPSEVVDLGHDVERTGDLRIAQGVAPVEDVVGDRAAVELEDVEVALVVRMAR